jgi:hypothetical protein
VMLCRARNVLYIGISSISCMHHVCRTYVASRVHVRHEEL